MLKGTSLFNVRYKILQNPRQIIFQSKYSTENQVAQKSINENEKQYLIWLGEQLKFKSREDWYNLTKKVSFQHAILKIEFTDQ